MVDSFRRHNPWFEGPVIVIFRGPPPLLNTTNLTFRPASQQLTTRLDAVTGALPAISGRSARFLSLETLAITGFDRLLFADSDLVIQGSVIEAFRAETVLAA
ncbi:MAG: hypothetical protein ACI9BV_003913, partial [Rhodothermales bacterium]